MICMAFAASSSGTMTSYFAATGICELRKPRLFFEAKNLRMFTSIQTPAAITITAKNS